MSKKLDLVLIHPGNRTSIYQGLGNTLSAIETPVWAGLLATHAMGKGFSVEIIDSEADDLAPDQVAERVASLDPRLVVVVVYGHQPSASSQNMTAAGLITRALKQREPERKVLLVGGHVSSLPDRTLAEEQADFACTGEGPITIAELLTALGETNPDMGKVRGLMFRDGPGYRRTEAPPLVQDLDREMPRMAYELLPMKKYRAHNWHCFGHLQRQPYASLYTTFGCPYKCTFCCIQAPFKEGEKAIGMKETVNSYRFWSPNRVVDTLEWLQKTHGVKNVKIADEMFVLNPKHVNGICDEITKRGLDFNIWAYARVDTVRDNMVDKLKAAGFNWLAFGVESAASNVRDAVLKTFDQDDVFETIAKVRNAGINVIANYIFGLPEDDLKSMQATLDLALELNCEFANFYCAMAYPGSELYQLALRENWQLPHTWAGYSQHAIDTLPLPTRHLSAGEVLAFRDRAFRLYHLDPKYLAMIDAKFGRETAEHIREMSSHDLLRKHAALPAT